MFKRLLFVTALLLASLASAPLASAQDTWQEGAVLQYDTRVGCGLQGGGYIIINLKGIKTIDRNAGQRTSVFELYIKTGNPGGVTTEIGPTTVQVPVDADYLSVSRDLGWAGLDASVPLYDAATKTNVVVDIHFQWYANTGTTQDGAWYKRGAVPAGTINLKGGGYSFQHYTNPCGRTTYLYSSREPRPRY